MRGSLIFDCDQVEAVVMCHRRIIDLENFLKTIMLELRTIRNGGVAMEFEGQACTVLQTPCF